MTLPRFDPHTPDLHLDRPVLLVVVDTEEEFDWSRPFDRQATGTFSIPAQARAHAIFDKFGVVPTYVMDYPVATSPPAARFFRQLVEQGRAHVGTHCHPWVTPPFDEEISTFNSYHGNLPRELELAKLLTCTDAVAQAIGQAPSIFKAGRYGVGPNTLQIIQDLGYTLDCSFVPFSNFEADGGPCFYGTPDQPFFLDASRRLLEVPLTVGVTGWFSALGRQMPQLFDHLGSRKFRLPGLGSSMRMMERARLSPEGFDVATQKRLIGGLLKQGKRIFTMTYHSPTLQPGNTPYVRSKEDLENFLQTIESTLDFFKNQVGGVFSTLSDIEKAARGTLIPRPA